MSEIFDRLAARLREAGVEFEVAEHAPVYTSEEAAAIRGTPMSSGAKALVVRTEREFLLAVMPADLSLKGSALRKLVRAQRLRFATREELLELTGLTPGAVPPFGSLFGLPTICDERLAENEWINFNAGSHERSLRMRYADWAAVESPRIARIAVLPEG